MFFEGSLIERAINQKKTKYLLQIADIENEFFHFFDCLEDQQFFVYKTLKLHKNKRTLQAKPQSWSNSKMAKSQRQDAALQNA